MAASDAVVTVDGFTVTRSTNQITDAINGVTLNVSSKTDSPVTLTIGPDASNLQAKLQTVVSAFNTCISSVHFAAGYGTITASNQVLAGDSALRAVTDRLGSTMASSASSGTFRMLAQVGISLTRDGTMTLDATKLQDALTKDPTGVASLLVDRMTTLKASLTSLTASTTGPLASRSKTLNDQAKRLDDWTVTEQDRLDNYATSLRKQFSAMDAAYAANQALISQLSKIGSST